MSVLSFIRRPSRRLAKSLAAVVAVTGFMLVGSALVSTPASFAADCDNNAIIYCGATTPSSFIQKVNANTTGDLKNIYSSYGLVPADYGRFVTSAKMGTAYKDGRIVVDGQVVGMATQSIGRQKNAGNTQQVVIAGHTYWGGPNSATFLSDSIPVMVLFNAQGVMQFAVLTSCGNPETVTPVTPQYSCNELNKTTVSGKANTYSFTTNATASKGAKLVKAVYNFGDGSTATVTNLSQPVQHTFTKTSKVTVTVYVQVPGGSTLTTTSIHCATTITVTPPRAPYAVCTNLAYDEINNNDLSYKFTANASYGNGARFISTDFNFGDGVTMTNVKPATATTAVASHTYASAKTYTIVATLHFTTPQGDKNVTCQTSLTPATHVQYCKPGVPVGSEACTDYCKPGIPVGSPACTTQTLTNTGPGALAGLFGGVSALATAGHYFIRKRSLQS